MRLKEKGQAIVASTFASLSSRLQAAISEGGFQQAVGVCKLAAVPITDSLERVHQVTIKRATNKSRNPDNQANEDEQRVLANYQALLDQKQALEPILQELESGDYQFYAPILTGKLCLNCHGKEHEDLSSDLAAYIKTLYPADQAMGYNAGDLRGVWSVTLTKEILQ